MTKTTATVIPRWLLLFIEIFLIMVGTYMRLLFSTFLFRVVALVTVFYVAFGAPAAFAGFGITPPYVRNTSLTRNSTYEQQILLVRGDPNTPLNSEVTVDAPEIQDWITIVEGTKILLPRGEQKIPMTVRVKVPSDAAYKEYSGKIRIRTVPTDDQTAEGVVSISLGAQVDVNLNVIDKIIKDFRVRRVSVSDLNEGHKFAWLYFPGKIDFVMSIENTGNTDITPSDVQFRIYDRTGSVMLEETHQVGSLNSVAPYATADITAHLPTRLPPGSYMIRYSIKNGIDIKQEGELNLSILPYGTLQAAGFGFIGLSLAHKISVLLPAFALMIIILYTIYNRRERRKRRVIN